MPGAGASLPRADPAPRRRVFRVAGRAALRLYVAAWSLVVLAVGCLAASIVAPSDAAAVLAVVVGVAALGLGLTAAAASQAFQRRADRRAYTGPSPVLVFAAAIALTLVAGTGLDAVGFPAEGPAAVLASALLTGGIALGLVALVVVRTGALSWREMGARAPAPWPKAALADVGFGAALAIPTLLGTSFLAGILITLLGMAPDSPLPVTDDPVGILVNLLAAAVIAPLWEESFFRGFVTTAWGLAAGRRAAIVRGAVFFALVHVTTLVGSDAATVLGTAFIAFAVRLPVGLVLAWVFLRRGSLVAPIALHATYNALPFLLLALSGAATP